MRFVQFPRLTLLTQIIRLSSITLALFITVSGTLHGQTAMEAFHWVDFHDAKDAPTIQWVTTELKAEKWTAIREIGVQWDSALVVTTLRETPQSPPPADKYTIWSVSLAKHEVQPLLHAVNPRIVDWTSFGGTMVSELGLVYDDCTGCDATTFFTTLYYSNKDHGWRARWMRGDQAAALYSVGNVDGVVKTQIYGLLTEPPGRNVLATWSHFDYGKAKPAEDFIYEYSVDPASNLEQMQALSDKHADQMKERLCKADPGQVDPALAELAHGQDSSICQNLVPAKTRPGRRFTTTPPANNHGRSEPPGARTRPAPAAQPKP
jgi:hypothetical protein